HLFNPSVAVNGLTAFVTASRTIPSAPTNEGSAAMLIFGGPNNSASGWAFDLVATSTAQMAAENATACNLAAKGACRWDHYSSTQIEPSNVTMAWGFNELVTGNTSIDWATRGAQIFGFGPPIISQSHDFNADLKSDIAWRHSGGSAAVWLMNGAQVSSAAIV